MVLENCTICIPLGGTISSHFLHAEVGNSPFVFAVIVLNTNNLYLQ